MITAVTIREVGPRDGLQSEAPVEPAQRAALVDALVRAGLGGRGGGVRVAQAVPAMAGADEAVRLVGRPPGVVRVALVPNLRGVELAVASGVDAPSASAACDQENVRMTIDESVESAGGLVGVAAGIPVDVVVSCALGSPYEGDIASEAVAGLCRRLVTEGATSLTPADTTAMAADLVGHPVPSRVAAAGPRTRLAP